MFCSKCGMKMKEGAKFCSSCGAPVAVKRNTVVPEDKNVSSPLSPQTGTSLQTTQKSPSQMGTPNALPNTGGFDINTGMPNFGYPNTKKRNANIEIIIFILIVAIIIGGGYYIYNYVYREKNPSHTVNESVTNNVEKPTVDDKSKNTSITGDEESINRRNLNAPTQGRIIAYNSPTPDGLFYYYHQKITQHDLYEAYRCFSPDFRQQVSYDGWAPGYDTTLKSYPEEIEILSNDGYRAVLSFRLMAQDNINGEIVIQYFAGQVTLYRINGLWKIDEISARKV